MTLRIGPLIKPLKHQVPIAGGAAQMLGDVPAMRSAKLEDLAGRLRRLNANLRDSTQEKGEPALPIATVADRLEMIVTGLPVALEEMR